MKARIIATAPTWRTNWRIGDRLHNRWQITKILRGGMGIVCIAYDHRLKTPVAIKTYSDDIFTQDQTLVERFYQEAFAWINLNNHRNLTKAYHLRKIEGRPCLLLEYVDGGDLSAWIATPRLTQDLPQVIRFAVQFCDGMVHALSKGIQAHRDIKPQNCLITSDNTLKITDLGLAKIFLETKAGHSSDEELIGERGVGWFRRFLGGKEKQPVELSCKARILMTQTGAMLGTPAYMAPEQYEDAKQVDVRADVYSFGVMLYQMVTGRLPFDSRNWEELERQHKTEKPPRVNCGVGELEGLIEKCLSKDPIDRYGGFEELRIELAGIYERLTGLKAPERAKALEPGAIELSGKGATIFELAMLKLSGKQITYPELIDVQEMKEEALRYIDRALKLDPLLADAWRTKALCLNSLGRTEACGQCLDRAIELDPDDDWAVYLKGLALNEQNRAEEALPYFDRAIDLNPHFAEIWSDKGMTLSALGRMEEALRCCDRAIELNPRLAQPWFNRGSWLKALGRPEEAIESYQRGIDLNPQQEWAWFYMGDLLNTSGKSREAMHCYNRAIELNPRLEGAWQNKGLLLLALGQIEDAVRCFDRAIELNPPREESWFGKGAALANLGCYREALACFERAPLLSSSPAGAELVEMCRKMVASEMTPDNSAEAWVNKGVAFGSSGRREEAIQCFDRAIELHPRFDWPWYAKGLALSELARDEEAISCYDRAVELNPRFDLAWYNRGISLKALGWLEEAIRSFDRAIESNPRLAWAWNNKGTSLLNLGRVEEAMQCIDRAIELDPRDQKAWINKGIVLTAMGRTVEAANCYNRAFELDSCLGVAGASDLDI
jgi:tetratricopeptide (TPR) repeat protein